MHLVGKLERPPTNHPHSRTRDERGRTAPGLALGGGVIENRSKLPT